MRLPVTIATAVTVAALATSASALSITAHSSLNDAYFTSSGDDGNAGLDNQVLFDSGPGDNDDLQVDASSESKPILPPGDLGLPDALELSSDADVINNTGMSGLVEVYFSETDYTLDPDPADFVTDATGNVGNFSEEEASIRIDTFIDTGNMLFEGSDVEMLESDDSVTRVVPGLTLDAALDSASRSGSFDSGDAFSLTQRVVFDLSGSGSADADLDTVGTASPIPLPAGMLLLLPALGGLAALRRRS